MTEGQPAAVDRESFDQLRREHRRLREDFDRLLQCLGEKKTPVGAAAKFFKGRFKAARRRRPLGPCRARLPNVLQRGPLSLVQRFCGGREELLRLREASRSSRACTDAIFTGYKIYVFGGFFRHGTDGNVAASTECLDVCTGTCEVWKPRPAQFYCAGAVMDGYVYACGNAKSMGAAARRFSPATKQWEVLASMTKRRTAPGAAVVGGRFYVCGGEDMQQRECHSSVEWLDLSVPPNKAGQQGAWRLLPVTMSAMRRHCVAAAIPGQDGKEELFVCGGFHTPCDIDSGVLDVADIIEVHGERGSRQRSAPPMPVPRGCHAGASLGGRVYVCGGFGRGHNHWTSFLATVDCYDPMLKVWSSSAPMPQPRMDSMAVVVAGCLYILGGKSPPVDPKSFDDPISYPRSIYCFDPATGEWEAAPWELVHGREMFSAAAVWTGVVRTGDLAARGRDAVGRPAAKGLPNCLQRRPLSLVQRFCGGREELLRLREASRSSRACTEVIFTGYKLYVFGGIDHKLVDGFVSKSAECLTVYNGAWEVLEPFVANWLFCAGAVMDGYFYACGTARDAGAAAVRFSFASKKWEAIASMSKRRSAPGAAVVGGRFYVCGGEDMRRRECHSSVEWLDLSVPPSKAGVQGAWRLLPVTMSAMRRNCVAAAIPGQDGKEELFVCGGFHTPSGNETGALDSADVIEVHGERGSRQLSVPPMPRPRGCHAGARLGGRVYMCGGYDGSNILAMGDCYDPVLEVWSSFAPMPQARAHSMAVAAAGCLWILGGKSLASDTKNVSNPIIYPRSIYFFNPGTGEWEAAPWELVHGREMFTAAAVWTGAVRTGDLAA